MDKKIIIAIDGWSSCGKSTLAKELARKLGYVYVDSGAMYRAITLYFIRHNVDYLNKEQVENALRQIHLSFQFNALTMASEIYLNGENVEAFIRNLDVAEVVSEVSTIKEIREFAVRQQQKMGLEKGIVMDGRDIGTVVFPTADLKIFMTADKEVRAQRRYKELIAKRPDITIEEVRENLQHRDLIDSTRTISPLKKAGDAQVLNNTNLSPIHQFQLAYYWAMEAITG